MTSQNYNDYNSNGLPPVLKLLPRVQAAQQTGISIN